MVCLRISRQQSVQQILPISYPASGIKQWESCALIEQLLPALFQLDPIAAQGDGPFHLGLGRRADQIVHVNGGAEAGPHARDKVFTGAGEQGQASLEGHGTGGAGTVMGGV